VPWETLLLSVVLYIVVPVIIAQIIRRGVIASGCPYRKPKTAGEQLRIG